MNALVGVGVKAIVNSLDLAALWDGALPGPLGLVRSNMHLKQADRDRLEPYLACQPLS